MVRVICFAAILMANFALADKRSGGTVPKVVDPKAAKEAEAAARARKSSTPADLKAEEGAARRRLGPTTGSGGENEGNKLNPRGAAVHGNADEATKFEKAPDLDLFGDTNPAPRGRQTVQSNSAPEKEEVGQLSSGDIGRRKDMTQNRNLINDKSFVGEESAATGKLKELLERERTGLPTKLTAEEQAELDKLKIEMAEMVLAQTILARSEKGSPTKDMVAKISQIKDAVAERMGVIRKAVEDAVAQGKVVDDSVVKNLERNIIDTYAGLGFNKGTKGSEALGLDKALENIKTLTGNQLVGYMKYLDSYGSAYRKARGELDADTGLPRWSVAEAHKMAVEARQEFVNKRAKNATSEELRSGEELMKRLCACTKSCPV